MLPQLSLKVLSSFPKRNLKTFNQKSLLASAYSTVDQTEVKRYDNLSGTWWDPHGPMKPLHSMNSVRIPFICNGLVNSGKLGKTSLNDPLCLKNVNILDVGCGGGILSLPLARLGGIVTGIDPTSELITVARNKAISEADEVSQKLNFICTSVEEHALQNKEQYDAVVLSEVVEHVTQKEEFLAACAETLKPGGSMFISTISQTAASWLFAIIIAPQLLRLLPSDIHEWDKMITPEELESYLNKVGCRTILTNGIGYEPIQNKWYWVPTTSVNYVLHAVKED